ncbi:glycosyltransferase family 2 protein [Tersicoccus sp. MR15.9]|uniref:glycosyltransferase family 2 protein n=1 Tax=Tersicoccus mangrovi TaxID=3121635 RepID=UPI002FE55893
MERLDIVFPCLNEAAALPRVLDRLPPHSHAIVVDNGSTDGSAAVAAATGATVVTETRRGFGAAAHAGLLAATAPLVAFCDADASLDPAELDGFRRLVEDGEADLVLGARRPGRGAWPLHARAANAILARRIRRATGYPVTDLGPLRLARREDLLALALTDRRSGYPLEMVLAASRAGWTVAERPVAYAPRVGRSKVTGTVRGTVTAVRDMSRLLRAHA